jgi:hypothetical protein
VRNLKVMSAWVLLFSTLVARESCRDHYWRKHDPIVEDRLLWRAQTFRHTVHLLPGQTILELGCGQLRFTRALLRVSRKENPIAAATFQSGPAVAIDGFQLPAACYHHSTGYLFGVIPAARRTNPFGRLLLRFDQFGS